MNKSAKTRYSRAEIIGMLSSEGRETGDLFERAAEIRKNIVGEKVYLRGLIEYSNICRKNCLYCGIRRYNNRVGKYTLTEDEVLSAAEYALENRLGSVVLQGGENTSPEHVEIIERLIREIKDLSGGRLGITLSLGEQSADTYRRWFEAGAHRYLLRIEVSSPELYKKLHPRDGLHGYEMRLDALHDLRRTGYQVGTGVMIGLPEQTVEDLADDIIFMHGLGIDMCGMGPYVESGNTPMAGMVVPPPAERLDMALKMVATLRIVMPDINIVAATALGSLSAEGRYRALGCGANVIMPNISPPHTRPEYALYDNKPADTDIHLGAMKIGYGEWGDPLHFRKIKKN